MKTTGQTQQTSSTTEAKTEPTTVVAEEVDATDFMAAFDANQLAAEKKYKDKRVKLTAYIQNISEDIMGSPFLALKPNNDPLYMKATAQCVFKKADELVSVKNGQQVTVEGTVTSQSLGIIGLKECSIVK